MSRARRALMRAVASASILALTDGVSTCGRCSGTAASAGSGSGGDAASGETGAAFAAERCLPARDGRGGRPAADSLPADRGRGAASTGRVSGFAAAFLALPGAAAGFAAVLAGRLPIGFAAAGFAAGLLAGRGGAAPLRAGAAVRRADAPPDDFGALAGGAAWLRPVAARAPLAAGFRVAGRAVAGRWLERAAFGLDFPAVPGAGFSDVFAAGEAVAFAAGLTVALAAGRLAADDLAAEDLAAEDLAAGDLAAGDLAAADLTAEDLAVPLAAGGRALAALPPGAAAAAGFAFAAPRLP